MDIKEKNLRKLSYGLYLIGAMDGERPCGCIVNTVFQVTSENPIIATSINKTTIPGNWFRKMEDFLFLFSRKKQEKKLFRNWVLFQEKITINMKELTTGCRMDFRS